MYIKRFIGMKPDLKKKSISLEVNASEPIILVCFDCCTKTGKPGT